MSKTIETNTNENIESNMSNIIEQIESKTKDIARNHIAYIPHFKAYLKNLPALMLKTMCWINAAKQISISATDQLAETNSTRMEHLLLLATAIGSKDLTIGSAWLCDNHIAEANPSRSFVDRPVHGDRDSSFGSWIIGNGMSVDFWLNADDQIVINPSRTIRSQCPQIMNTRLSNCDIFNSVSRTSDWHGTTKSGSENLIGKKN